MPDIWVQILGQEDPLEKEMETHSSILAWEIPQKEKPGGLESIPVTLTLGGDALHEHVDDNDGARAADAGARERRGA